MLWYNSIVLNKMFRGILSLSLNLFYLETVAKGSKLNKTEEKLKKEQKTYLLLTWQPSRPSLTGPAHRRFPPLSSSSLARRTSACRRARARTPPPASTSSCLSARFPDPLEMPRTSLAPRPLLPPSLSPSALSPSRDRTEPVAADQRSRGRSHPEASPTRPRAPPVLPRPPRRLTRPEEPRNAAPDVFPLLGHRRSASPSRSLRRFPGPVVCTGQLPVSSSSFSPSPFSRLHAVVAALPTTETRRRPRSSPVKPW